MFDPITGQGDRAVKLRAVAQMLIGINKIEGGFVVVKKIRLPASFLVFFNTLMEEAKDASQARSVSRLFQEPLTENIPSNTLGSIFMMELKMHVRTGNHPGFSSCIHRAYRLVQNGKLDHSLFPFPCYTIPKPSNS